MVIGYGQNAPQKCLVTSILKLTKHDFNDFSITENLYVNLKTNIYDKDFEVPPLYWIENYM